jgi:Ras-related protein Rab-18
MTHCVRPACVSCIFLLQGEAVRAVSPDQGAAFARDHGCLYKETSAKTDKGGVDEGVYDALVWGECAGWCGGLGCGVQAGVG